MKRAKRLVAAITGYTGSGKTFFSGCLRKMGATVIDVDVLVHGLYAEGKPLYRAVVSKYPGVTGRNGEIDRKKLGAIIFSGRKEYRQFTAIVYPAMIKGIKNAIKPHKGPVYLDMAVLFESNFDSFVDRIIYINVSDKVWKKRLSAETGKDYKGIRKYQNDIPRAKKIAKSDYIIYNDGTKRELCKKAEEVFSAINREFYGR